ncbi:MAG: hypothetical protein PWP76_581 [Candidatus Diapherotrites archaeon]|nr:hypothetical protein [Candidatus Diapherotrites archaeon]MDN5367159.1 hypothetical protein [Candidatus Diapherotrites archaeon]
MSALRSLLAGRGSFCSIGSELPKEKGTYILLLELDGSISVRTKYGRRNLEPGIYAYVGSAFGPGGLRARIERHWRKEKRKHWHIDDVTTSDHCKQIGAFVFPGEQIEGELAEMLGRVFKPVPGFGASDSREDTHLFQIQRDNMRSSRAE